MFVFGVICSSVSTLDNDKISSINLFILLASSSIIFKNFLKSFFGNNDKKNKTTTEISKKIICLNRKASFNYFFLEVLEAGISLKGSEVKSLREGKGSIADSYAVDNNGELFLINSHIPLYRQSSYNNHDPKGDRKLLLNRKEINKLIGRINQDGLTLIPTKLYFSKGKVKVEIAVAKGKKLYDKRQVKKTRDWNREKARLLNKK